MIYQCHELLGLLDRDAAALSIVLIVALLVYRNCMEAILKFAIKHKKMLRLTYLDLVRVVEPYMYGLHKNRQQVLYCYQTAGDSTAEEEGWREFFLYQIHHLEMLPMSFPETREEYRKHKTSVSTIYCETPAAQ